MSIKIEYALCLQKSCCFGYDKHRYTKQQESTNNNFISVVPSVLCLFRVTHAQRVRCVSYSAPQNSVLTIATIRPPTKYCQEFCTRYRQRWSVKCNWAPDCIGCPECLTTTTSTTTSTTSTSTSTIATRTTAKITYKATTVKVTDKVTTAEVAPATLASSLATITNVVGEKTARILPHIYHVTSDLAILASRESG